MNYRHTNYTLTNFDMSIKTTFTFKDVATFDAGELFSKVQPELLERPLSCL